MKFTEVLKHMKAGEKVKLPSLGGYWHWEPEKETIMMHTQNGDELDIRETQAVEYTVLNICSDEWVLADENNCPELGGEATFSFGEAIKYLKRGLKVARKGWNGKGMYLFLGYDIAFSTGANLKDCVEMVDLEGNSLFYLHDSICMRTVDKSIVVGWLASQSDVLADDWVFVD